MTRVIPAVLIPVLAAAIVACGGVAGVAPGPAAETAPISPTGSNGVDFNYDRTELVSAGESFEFRMACIHSILLSCVLLSGGIAGEPGFAARVAARTEGQVRFRVTSFPELDVVGANTMRLISDGTLAMAEIYSGHVGDEFPELDVSNLWGLYPTTDSQLDVIDAIQPEMRRLTADNGGVQLFYSYTADNFLFSRYPIRSPADFRGLKVRSHSPMLSDLLAGLGAEPQSVPFADVYTELGQGALDAAVSCGSCGYGVRWFEVSDYLAGPIVSIVHSWFAMNQAQWNRLPADLQNIILEEGARHSAINRKLLREQWQQDAVNKNLAEGMASNPFDETLLRAIQDASIQRVVPRWVERVGGPTSPMARLFNEKAAPIVGVAIRPDGSAARR